MEPPHMLPREEESEDEGIAPRPATPPQPIFNSVWNLDPVYFRVEHEIFCVNKKPLLVPGNAFVDMFAMPSGPQSAEGLSAHNPIALEGIKASHFSALLSVLYPWTKGAVSLYNQDEEGAFGVLGLANMWLFTEIRRSAIQKIDNNHISKKTSMEKIRLGKMYFVKDWVAQGYDEIVRTTNLEFGALAEEPYCFDPGLERKILHLQANTETEVQRRRHYGEPDVWTRRSHPGMRDLLRDEIEVAAYAADEHVSQN